MKAEAKVLIFILLSTVFIGAFRACAQTSNAPGTIVEWGSDCCCGYTNVPPSLTNVVAVAAGFPILGLRSDSFLTGWGCGSYGSLPVPPYATNVPVIAMAAGVYHSEVLQVNGTVVAWGDEEFGQVEVPPQLTNVVAIATGDYDSLALKADGTVTGWGESFDFSGNELPWTNIVAVSVGGNHHLGLMADGTVVIMEALLVISLAQLFFPRD